MLTGKEEKMANNIMKALKDAGYLPDHVAAVGNPFWVAVSKGIIETIVTESEIKDSKVK